LRRPVYSDAWSDEVKAVYRHDVQEIWEPSLQPHIWSQYQNQLEIYQRIVRDRGDGLRILDVGCAQATLALLLAEAGHKVVALDLRQEFLDYARNRHSHGDIRFLCANALEFETDERFDIVFANQLIEHLVHPLKLLNRLRSLLAPSGTLVVTTPNWSYAVSRLPSFKQLGDPEQHEERQFSADGDGHFFAYTAAELLDLFRAAGFSRASATFFESPFISGHMKLRYAHRFAPPGLLKALDRVALLIPFFGARLAHQLMVTGKLD
jgi:2-polyprenyl-3-methyl-5-hydroxy-6-metoxy-1,4-benzoquinol methylase